MQRASLKTCFQEVAGFGRNRRPTSVGISGRNESEWVAGLLRNQWPESSGICNIFLV